MTRPTKIFWLVFGVIFTTALVATGMIYVRAMRPPSDDELICEAKFVASKFFAPITQPLKWSPTIRVEHPDADHWRVSGDVTNPNLGPNFGGPGPHQWKATLERISIGRVEVVELHIDGRRVLQLDPDFLRSPNSRYHSGPTRERCSGR